jgi:hypothetical protein
MPFAIVERRSNLSGKLFQGIGFLQKVRLQVKYVVIEHGLSCIPGHEEKLNRGRYLFKFFRQFASTHIGHYDIGYDQIDCRRVILGYS